MNYRRRFLSLWILLALLLSRPAWAEPIQLELWTMQLKPDYTALMTDMVEQFQKLHPQVRVHWVDIPWAEMEKKALVAMAGGHPPDVINLNPNFSNKLAESGALYPLEGAVPAAVKVMYFPAAWEATRIRGRTFGVPWYLSTAVTITNRELFRQAGLDPEKPPRTSEELARVAVVIKEKTGRYAFLPILGDKGKFMEILVQDGVELLTADGKRAAFNTPVGVRTLQFWVDLYRQKLVPRESLTASHRSAIDLFQGGQTAILPAGPQFLALIKKNSPQLYPKLGVGPQITGRSGKVGMGVMNLVVARASAHPAEAVELALFVTNAANQLALCKPSNQLPSIQAALKDLFYSPRGNTLEERARRINARQLARAVLLVKPMPRQTELGQALDEALQKAALGRATPAEALAEAEKKWNSILSR